MVQQKRAFDTRDRVIDGAAQAFYRLGYGMATTSDIVVEAGVTRGAMYFHFPSKEDLARAIIEKEQLLTAASSARIVGLDRSAFETMVLLCVDLAERLVKDPVVRAGVRLTTEVTNFDPPLRAPYELWLETFTALAARAADQGDFREDLDAGSFARFFIPAYTGVQLVSDTFSSRIDLLPRLHEMWQFVLPAVASPDRISDCRDLVDSLIPSFSATAVRAK